MKPQKIQDCILLERCGMWYMNYETLIIFAKKITMKNELIKNRKKLYNFPGIQVLVPTLSRLNFNIDKEEFIAHSGNKIIDGP